MKSADDRNWAQIHPKVSAPVFAGAVAAFTLGILREKAGFDLQGQEANLMIIVAFLAGYLFPDGEKRSDDPKGKK